MSRLLLLFLTGLFVCLCLESGKKRDNSLIHPTTGQSLPYKSLPPLSCPCNHPYADPILFWTCLPGALCSIKRRKLIAIPIKMRHLSAQDWEDKAASFLQHYFSLRFPGNANLISDAPPTESLEHIKGYVTGSRNYWENIEITLDNLQVIDGKLMVQCTVEGEYIPQNTPYITDEPFHRPYILENDYSDAINSLCIRLIDDFKTSLPLL